MQAGGRYEVSPKIGNSNEVVGNPNCPDCTLYRGICQGVKEGIQKICISAEGEQTLNLPDKDTRSCVYTFLFQKSKPI